MSQARIFVTLDVMRGVAAIAVLAHHCAPLLGPWLSPGSAYLAVDLFFMLSGFVLALAYSDRLNSSMTAGEFLRARIIRIYPLFALGMLFGAAAAVLMLLSGSTAWTPAQIARDTITSLLMIPSFPWDGTGPFRNHLFTLNGPAWSLLYEMCINVVFAFLPLRYLKSIAPLLVVSGFGIVGIAFYYHTMDVGAHYYEFLSGLIRVTFGFFMGVALYSFHQKLSPIWTLPAGVILAITALLLVMPISEILRPWYDAGCVLFFFPAIVFLGATVQPQGFIRRGGEALGIASYALYATHTGLLLIFSGLWARLSPTSKGHPSPLIGLLFIAGMVAFALTLHQFYDVRVRRWLSAKTRSPKQTFA